MTEDEANAPPGAAPEGAAPRETAAPAEGMNVPDGLLYAETDEWAKIEENIATIGITDHAQHQLGDIVGLEVSAEVGKTVAKTEAVGVVESVKAVADLHSPVSGTVKEINPMFTGDSPDLDAIKSEPYSAWLIKVELSDPTEKGTLMSAEAYKAKIKG